MAAKTNKNQLTFDIGTPEEAFTCTCCHTGGGPYEYDRDGRRLDSVDPDTVPPLHGDYYSYYTDETAQGALGRPHKFDWKKSGCLEADCLVCHIDPDKNRITDATGIKPAIYNPRLRIFAERKHGKAMALSIGIYPGKGWESAFCYSDPLPQNGESFLENGFYADLENPLAEVMNYLKAPFVEGQGKPYVMVPAKREFLGHFFRYSPSAALMGLDTNADGYPLTYLKLTKEKEEFVPHLFYETAEFDSENKISFHILGSSESGNGESKWTRVCAQCHVGIKDPINGSWRVRSWGARFKSDIVKRGEVWDIDPAAATDPGYDVHTDAGFDCVTCHARSKPDGVAFKDYVKAPDHNFLKGCDSGNSVRNDLDNNPPPKNCVSCHIDNDTGPNPEESHFDCFGPAAKTHFKEIACQTCHIPSVKYWSFRCFDYSLGLNYNYDSRNITEQNGSVTKIDLPAYYGPMVFYGTANTSRVVANMEKKGRAFDQLVPFTYIIPGRSDDAYGKRYKKISGRSDFDRFPVLYPFKGLRGNQIIIGNPVTVITWLDKTSGKILFPREINAAVKGLFLDKTAKKRFVGLITGKKIYDETGFLGQSDLRPEIKDKKDLLKMQKALIRVLKQEGERDPSPVLYIAAHYFKISHNVLPAEYALGSNGSCTACHGKNGRIMDRIVSFTPSCINGFEQLVKDGLVFVDPEIGYIKPIDLDKDGQYDILGAYQKEIIAAVKEHIE